MILRGQPTAKAAIGGVTDADMRRRGDQTGLDNPVVHAVNYECQKSDIKCSVSKLTR